MGYFIPANVSGVQSVSRPGVASTAISLNDGLRRQVKSCSIGDHSSSTIGILVLATVNARIDHTVVGIHDDITGTISMTAASCSTSSDPGFGKFEVFSSLPTGCCWEGTIALPRRFTLAAGTSGPYYLNSQSLSGVAGDDIRTASVQCTLDP